MRLVNWEYEAYLTLLKSFGLRGYFTVAGAMEKLAYSKTSTWKVLNDLERKGIIKKQRSKENWKVKKYRLTTSPDELLLVGEQIPTNKLVGMPQAAKAAGIMPSSTQVIYSSTPVTSYKMLFRPGGAHMVSIRKGNYDDASFVAERIKARNTAFNSRYLQSGETNFSDVIKRLNSFDFRYLGAVADILLERGVEDERTKKIIIMLRDGLFRRTEKDSREFGIFPKDLRKQPKELDAIAAKWRIYLNISPAEVELI
ncbi:MAG: hypothetical protein AABX01_00860 [Candidatus Micrarchaeota archaeon]